MLVLRALVTTGELPLLGPPTSIGDFHHGVLYYYLLAPAAALTGADPLGVVGAIALAGVAAVGVTWWLARAIGGPVAGAVAGLLMAVSASGGRRVDVHLEPESHRAFELDRPRGSMAGVDGRPGRVVDRCRARGHRHDALPRARQRPPTAGRRAVGRGRSEGGSQGPNDPLESGRGCWP